MRALALAALVLAPASSATSARDVSLYLTAVHPVVTSWRAAGKDADHAFDIGIDDHVAIARQRRAARDFAQVRRQASRVQSPRTLRAATAQLSRCLSLQSRFFDVAADANLRRIDGDPNALAAAQPELTRLTRQANAARHAFVRAVTTQAHSVGMRVPRWLSAVAA